MGKGEVGGERKAERGGEGGRSLEVRRLKKRKRELRGGFGDEEGKRRVRRMKELEGDGKKTMIRKKMIRG